MTKQEYINEKDPNTMWMHELLDNTFRHCI